jgi:hypothetical protein
MGDFLMVMTFVRMVHKKFVKVWGILKDVRIKERW